MRNCMVCSLLPNCRKAISQQYTYLLGAKVRFSINVQIRLTAWHEDFHESSVSCSSLPLFKSVRERARGTPISLSLSLPNTKANHLLPPSLSLPLSAFLPHSSPVFVTFNSQVYKFSHRQFSQAPTPLSRIFKAFGNSYVSCLLKFYLQISTTLNCSGFCSFLGIPRS